MVKIWKFYEKGLLWLLPLISKQNITININKVKTVMLNKTQQKPMEKQILSHTQPGADLGLIWQWSPLLGMRKLAPKEIFSSEKQTCICDKKTLIYIKVSLLRFSGSLLCNKATRSRLGVSEHPLNPPVPRVKSRFVWLPLPKLFF